MENQHSYNLQQISNWPESKFVSLPTVQRGFVWKPSQIENLWDSLLRGYPIGAFVLSPDNNHAFHILDGQQRATAICLGFAKKTFRDSQDSIKVFIDLERPASSDNRKFIFRVITRSHPWGYRKQENNKTLTSENIRKSLENRPEINDPLTTPLGLFYPYDAGFPVPFHYFIAGALQNLKVSELISRISQWDLWEKVKENWMLNLPVPKEGIVEIGINQRIEDLVSLIYNATFKMLDNQKGQRIPALYMDIEQLMQDDEPEQENASDEVENLFIRLNSGGTQLSGEELNYSILKSRLKRGTQDVIEEACKKMFKPARFITIAFRLFQQDIKEADQADALTMRIKPKQFQRTINKQAELFEAFLLKLIEEKIPKQKKTLLEYTLSVLAYNQNNQKYGFPDLLVSSISDDAPELMFLLLYRIRFKKDRFEPNTDEHRSMLGIMSLFLWFGKGEKLKDHSKLLSNIWPTASTLEKDRFWSAETVERALLNAALLPIPAFKSTGNQKGLDTILQYKITEKSKLLQRFTSETNEQFGPFLQKAVSKREILLYAQRSFIQSYFREEQFHLEDTCVPFDWDHISPNRLVHAKKNLPAIIIEWYQSIGNFRAWPYALNRMDSDNCPSIKLRPLNKKNFANQNNSFENAETKWLSFVNQNKHVISGLHELDPKLLQWSFCEGEWAKCNIDDMHKAWQNVISLIVRRNILILQEWYTELNIDKLRLMEDFDIVSMLDKRNWKKGPIGITEIDGMFNQDEFVWWFSKPILIDSHTIRFYIYYRVGEREFLDHDGFFFGIYEQKGGGYINQMKGKTSYVIDQKGTWIENGYTLVSNRSASVKQLLSEIKKWFFDLPVDKKYQIALFSKLNEALSINFRIK